MLKCPCLLSSKSTITVDYVHVNLKLQFRYYFKNVFLSTETLFKLRERINEPLIDDANEEIITPQAKNSLPECQFGI